MAAIVWRNAGYFLCSLNEERFDQAFRKLRREP